MCDELFWAKVDANGVCWQWTGANNGRYGFVKRKGTNYMAHRFGYVQLMGEIPAGLELDHLCRNKLCVNPDHMEPVTHKVNVQRGSLKYVNKVRRAARV